MVFVRMRGENQFRTKLEFGSKEIFDRFEGIDEWSRSNFKLRSIYFQKRIFFVGLFVYKKLDVIFVL